MRVFSLFALSLAAAPLEAQNPAPRSLTLEQAIALGRERGVSATLARISERIANSRVGQRRADLLPSVTLSGSATRQTLNLDEFGIPIASGVTDPFTLWRFQVQGRETLFDASTYARLRSARDSAIAVGNDARAAGELAGASAGLAYLRVLSANETVSARKADSTVSADLLAQSRQQVNAGTNAAIDATRSETQFAAVLTQLEVARNQRDRAQLDLVRALDLPVETELVLADSLSTPARDLPSIPDTAVSFALEHRSEVAAERGRTRVAERWLKPSASSTYPTSRWAARTPRAAGN